MIQRINSAAFAAMAFLAFSFAGVAGAAAIPTHEPLRGAWTNSVDCLTPPARALIDSIEAKFGKMNIISTCRPGARVAGTGQISRHSSGNAIDFIAGDRKAAVLDWLIATHTNGGTMTYSDSPHIHVDIGPHWVQLASGYRYAGGGDAPAPRRRHTATTRLASADAPKAHSRHRVIAQVSAFTSTQSQGHHHLRRAVASDSQDSQDQQDQQN